MASVVDNPGKEVLATAREGLDSFLSGLVLARARSQGSLVVLWGREAWRGKGRLLVGVRRVAGAVCVEVTGSSQRLREDVSDRGKPVAGLLCRNVVDVGGLGEIGGSVCELPGGRHVVAETSEGLVNGGRLNHPLVGKLNVRGRGNGKAWRRLLPAGGVGSLQRPAKGAGILLPRIFVGRTLSAVLLAGLDDLPLPFPDVHTPLKLFAHRGIVCVEAWRQAGEAEVLAGGKTSGPCGEGAGSVDHV